MTRPRTNEARLAISRCAAALFWKNGIDGTSGDDIADAAGISKRTVWRYFRSKEACVEPLFLATGLRFINQLRQWPREIAIEAYLRDLSGKLAADEQAILDGIAAVRIISMMRKEPQLRSAWLMACSEAETELASVIADRVAHPTSDFDIKLCAAAVMAAIRVVDEELSLAAINEGRRFGPVEPFDRLAAAIRAASTISFCDPVSV